MLLVLSIFKIHIASNSKKDGICDTDGIKIGESTVVSRLIETKDGAFDKDGIEEGILDKVGNTVGLDDGVVVGDKDVDCLASTTPLNPVTLLA